MDEKNIYIKRFSLLEILRFNMCSFEFSGESDVKNLSYLYF